jgi:hypothetical protein
MISKRIHAENIGVGRYDNTLNSSAGSAKGRLILHPPKEEPCNLPRKTEDGKGPMRAEEGVRSQRGEGGRVAQAAEDQRCADSFNRNSLVIDGYHEEIHVEDVHSSRPTTYSGKRSSNLRLSNSSPSPRVALVEERGKHVEPSAI